MRQRLKITQLLYKLSVVHYGDNSVFTGGKIRLLVGCDAGAKPHAIDMDTLAPVRDGDLTRLSATLSAADVPCLYPELTVQGFGDGSTRNTRIGLGEIRLYR